MPLLSTIGAAAARAFGFLKALVLGYEVDNSLRFNRGSSDSLTRTPASSGNRRTYTISTWLKRATLSTAEQFIGASTTNFDTIGFDSSDRIRFYIYNNPTSTVRVSTQVFRDVSAWYHIVIAVDTTNATDQNRCRIYVNGTEITAWATNNSITQNLDTSFNQNVIQYVGAHGYAPDPEYFNGYMSEVYMIDGQQLTPSSFGKTDSATGIWTPIAYSGSYGTNGFFLKFANSAALGTDSSGNGNNFTVNNLTSLDQTTDTPTNNFATLNAVDNIASSGSGTLTQGNTNVSYTGGGFNTNATIAANKGKWYWETKAVANATQGFVGMRLGFREIPDTYSEANTLENASFCMYVHPTVGVYTVVNGSNVLRSGSLTYVDGDIIGIALDLDNNISYWYKNGTLTVTYDFSAQSTIGTKNLVPAVGNGSGTANPELNLNFGNPSITIASGNADANGYGNFEYTVPSGYYALNTKNLAEYA